MKRLLDVAQRYLSLCTWKDIALLKTCVLAAGVLIGLMIPSRRKKMWAWIFSGLFVATYIPLMWKFLPCFQDEADEEDGFDPRFADDDEMDDFYNFLFDEED